MNKNEILIVCIVPISVISVPMATFSNLINFISLFEHPFRIRLITIASGSELSTKCILPHFALHRNYTGVWIRSIWGSVADIGFSTQLADLLGG